MTITAAATATPISKPNGVFQFVEPQTGNLTSQALQFFNNWYNFIVGMNRLTPCNATGTNVITLTPLASSPLITGYVDFEVYTFVAANGSTGSVTATVVPANGTLA